VIWKNIQTIEMYNRTNKETKMTRAMFDIAKEAIEKLRVSTDRCRSDSPGLSMRSARFLELSI
jgi:hypothetical protein